MVIVHSNLTLNAALGRFNHHYFGWVEDAQGFIFLSGLVVGLVYGGILDKKGPSALWKAVFKRCGEIYKYHIALILLFLLGALTVFSNADVLKSYATEPAYFTLASATLISASMHMGILPMYIYFFMATPLFLMAFKRGYIAPVVIVSLSLWIFAQTGMLETIQRALEAFVAHYGVKMKFSIFFNIFGWQVLFTMGLFVGYRLANGKLNLDWLKQPQWTFAAYIGMATIVALGIFDRIIFNELISPGFSAAFLARTDRGVFADIYFVAFLADLFVVTWLLVAGINSPVRLIRGAARVVHSVFSHKALVFLGQHSLQVFAFHMLVVYGIDIAFKGRPPAPLLANGLLILCVLSLYIPAWLHAQVQRREKAKKAAAKQAGALATAPLASVD
ncbi:OpgC domain-containing protein [Phenylobacterium sp. LjRoot225]